MNYTIMLQQQLLILQHYSLLHLTVVDAMGEYFMNKGLRVLAFTMILVNMRLLIVNIITIKKTSRS